MVALFLYRAGWSTLELLPQKLCVDLYPFAADGRSAASRAIVHRTVTEGARPTRLSSKGSFAGTDPQGC